jgi:DHA1 family multidrug resistance protein-like MFS transporter
MLRLSGPICLMMFVSLPEISAANILFRGARRLRKVIGKSDLLSQSEIDHVGMSVADIAYEALIKPVADKPSGSCCRAVPGSPSANIPAADQAIKAFMTLCTALVHGIFYSFFESSPLVFPVMYHFNLSESSLPFLTVVVALLICVPSYCGYYYYKVELQVKKTRFGPPEQRLIHGLIATFFVLAGLFVFGELSRSQYLRTNKSADN